MKRSSHHWRIAGSVALVTGLLAFSGWTSAQMGSMSGGAMNVTLSGGNEVPPVTTAAKGTGTITIKDDHTVSGSVTVTGMTPTAAHIHEAAPGVNGPVIVPMTKSGDNMFIFPATAKLTDAQYASFKAGNTYVNVHSAANPGGEIRAQLK
jgi:CHRD domain